MSEYLLNSNLLILVTVVCTAAWLLFYLRVLKDMPLKLTALSLGACLLLFLVEFYAIWRSFGLQSTPAGAFYIAFACNVALVCTILNWRKRKALLYGGVAFLCSLLLLTISINDYYQYFPTIHSIFIAQRRHTNTTTNLAAHQQTTKAIGNIEQALYGSPQQRGSVVSTNIPGTVSHLKTRTAYIYLPPDYTNLTSKNIQYPVLVLLTGTPGTPSSWLQGGQFTTIMDTFAEHHRGITPIIVIADHTGSFTNDTECIDSPHGNADTYLTQDVPAYIKSTYRVSASPNNWGIGGFSEGGMCAAMLTLKHQDVYRHFLDLSGDPFPYLNNAKQTIPVLFHGSAQAAQTSNVDWLLKHQPVQPGLTAQFAIGANDNKRLISEMQHTYHLAISRNIPSTYESVAHEGHSFAAWSRGYADALPKLSHYLGATECDVGCTQ